MIASISACRSRGAASIIAAVPVMPSDRVEEFKKMCDELVFVMAAKNFSAVGQFYQEFGQTDDHEVISSMQTAASRMEQCLQQQQKHQTPEAGGESIDISEAVL
jgi:putative phosphoribosyl transferase